MDSSPRKITDRTVTAIIALWVYSDIRDGVEYSKLSGDLVLQPRANRVFPSIQHNNYISRWGISVDLSFFLHSIASRDGRRSKQRFRLIIVKS